MTAVRRCLAVLVAAWAAWPGVAHSGTRGSVAAFFAAAPKVVLIAGDYSLPVFDDAVSAMIPRLWRLAGGIQPDLTRLSAVKMAIRQEGARSASLDHVLRAVVRMKPAAGRGCFVFATSHGVAHEGLYLGLHNEVLTPADLDQALVRGCGSAPTVVVISGCFSGSFVQAPMDRPGRIVLTAARADRTSFGCHAGRLYTVFDECLLSALGEPGTWRQVFASTKDCVGAEERRENVTPSDTQAWFAADMGEQVP